MAVAFRFAMAHAPIYGLAEQGMRFVDALAKRDQQIMIQVLNLYPREERNQHREAVKRAIKTAASRWEHEYLPILVGKEQAAGILKQMRRTRSAANAVEGSGNDPGNVPDRSGRI